MCLGTHTPFKVGSDAILQCMCIRICMSIHGYVVFPCVQRWCLSFMPLCSSYCRTLSVLLTRYIFQIMCVNLYTCNFAELDSIVHVFYDALIISCSTSSSCSSSCSFTISSSTISSSSSSCTLKASEYRTRLGTVQGELVNSQSGLTDQLRQVELLRQQVEHLQAQLREHHHHQQLSSEREQMTEEKIRGLVKKVAMNRSEYEAVFSLSVPVAGGAGEGSRYLGVGGGYGAILGGVQKARGSRVCTQG